MLYVFYLRLNGYFLYFFLGFIYQLIFMCSNIIFNEFLKGVNLSFVDVE